LIRHLFPSLGVLLRMPPGGDVCSLARWISTKAEAGCLYEPVFFRLVRGLSPPLRFFDRLVFRETMNAMGFHGKQWKFLGKYGEDVVLAGVGKQHLVVITARFSHNPPNTRL
jgi:hypothetical protein